MSAMKNKTQAKENLAKRLNTVIEKAKENKVSERQIRKHIESSIKKHRPPKRCSCLRTFCKCSFVLVIVMVAIVIAIDNSIYLQSLATPIVLGYASHVLSVVRKISVAVTSRVTVDHVMWGKWYAADCYVDNPLKTPINMSCDTCKYVYKVTEREKVDTEKFESEFRFTTKPLKSKLPNFSPVCYQELRQKYMDNPHLSQVGINWLESLHIETNNVTTFMSEKTYDAIWQVADLHAEWHMKRPGPSALLRKLYPLPSFVPRKTEIGLHSMLIIDAAKSEPVPLDLKRLGTNALYVQGCGEREIQFVPSDHCTHVCKAYGAILEAGDVMFFDTSYWSIVSKPVQDTLGEVSIAYVRTLM